MNGAVSLLTTLARNGVTTSFMNPGTSEMHFVAALDDVPEVRGVLCLFEGVASGAADGFGRVTGTPAATLVHLGPGLGNAFANLHNARRAHTPVLNIVGDHATYHGRFDAPLQSDIAAISSALDGWHRSSARADDVAADAADAIAASFGPPGRVATLVLPADSSWNELTSPTTPAPIARRASVPRVAAGVVEAVGAELRTKRAAILLGGPACRARGLTAAARIAAATGCRLLTETFPSVLDRGGSLPIPERLNYLGELALAQLEGVEVLFLAGATSPVSFFAYPHLASSLVPPSCEVVELAGLGVDAPDALESLASLLDAPAGAPDVTRNPRPGRPTGPLDTRTLADAIGSLLPEGCVVVDEANTSGIGLLGATEGAPPHEWLSLCGGAIGYGLPAAVGAAIGSGRRVVCVESDGSMCYTPQALWTMAREGLDVTVVCCSNDSYAILNYELSRVGATASGARAKAMLDLSDPTLDLAGVATSFGVPSSTVTTADELVVAFDKSLSTPGPTFINARLASIFR
jgi:acetolactate synthase-1/2/3 large subunit